MKRVKHLTTLNLVVLGIFLGIAGIWGYNTVFTETVATPTNENAELQTVKYDKSQDGQELAGEQTAVANDFPIIVDGREIEYSALKVEINEETADLSQLMTLLGDKEVKPDNIMAVIDGKEVVVEDATALLSLDELRINGLSDVLGGPDQEQRLFIFFYYSEGKLILVVNW